MRENDEIDILMKSIRVVNIRRKSLKKLIDIKEYEINNLLELNNKKKKVEKIEEKINQKSKTIKFLFSNHINKKENQKEEILKTINTREKESKEKLKIILEKTLKEIKIEKIKIYDDLEFKKYTEEKLLSKINLGPEKYAVEELIKKETQQFKSLIQLQNNFQKTIEKELEQMNKLFSKINYENDLNELINHLNEERSIIATIKQILNLLKEEYKLNKKEGERISSSESKKLKELNLKQDILLYSKELGELLKKDVHKTEVVINYLNKQRRIRSELNIKSLIAVHITEYLPKKGIISTLGSVRGTKYTRETVHFTLNGAVGDHGYGKFKGKFAILIPLNKIIDRIINIAPMDSFTLGTVKIPSEGEILYPYNPEKDNPEELKHKIRKQIGNLNIILYDRNKDLRKEIVPKRIREKGYSVTSIGTWGWTAINNIPEEIKKKFTGLKGSENFYEFGKQIEKTAMPHSNTGWSKIEKMINILINEITINETNKKDSENDHYKSYIRAVVIKDIVKTVFRTIKGKEEEIATKRLIKRIEKIEDFYKKEYHQIIKNMKNEFTKACYEDRELILNNAKDFKQIYENNK